MQRRDDAAADRLAAGLRADTGNDDIDRRQALSVWRDRQIERWKAAKATDAAAAAALLDAAGSWEPFSSDMMEKLRREATPAELLAAGKERLRAGSFGAAVALLQAAGRDEKTLALLDDAYFGLAGQPEMSSPVRGGWPNAVMLYERVYGPRRAAALRNSAAIVEAWADTRAASEPDGGAGLYAQALSRLKASAELEKKEVSAADRDRLTLKSEEGRFAASLYLLSSNYERAFEELRPVLRSPENPRRRERAVAALREAWRKTRDGGSFDRLVDFTAYLVAECGPPAHKDAFRKEFKDGLAALAERARSEALNKRVFALSLLADAFPDDPDARAARREATERGSELAHTTTNRGEQPRSLGPSGLTGRSAALVENKTPHHILMTYSGPESFFVRVNPYRRGTVVIKDGKYLVGVATVKDDIRSYALEATYDTRLEKNSFVIVGSGGKSDDAGLGSAYGVWTLLRAPEGEKPAVDPRTGRP